MKMTKELKTDGSKIKNAFFPSLGWKQEKILDHWEGVYSPYSGHDLIAKVLTLAGYETFRRKHKLVDESTFILYTEDKKPVQISITYSDVDNASKVIIKNGDLEEHYEVITVNGTSDIIITPERTNNLSTHFTQYYNTRHDSFFKNEDGIRIYVSIGRDSKENGDNFYYIDEDIKQEFINTKFNNLLEVYQFIKRKFDISKRLISMTSYRSKDFSLLDSIKIVNGSTNELTLSTLMSNNRIRLEGENPNTALINDLIGETNKPGAQMRLTIK
jgi:hypothetical protein